MPAPVVVIEMPAADRASPLAETMLAACSKAVAEGRCTLSGESEETEVSAVAIVTWAGTDRRAVGLLVGLRRVARAGWLSRRVEFREADAMAERWRAVGLVIATLVGEADREARGEGAGAQGGSTATSPAAPTPPAPPPVAAPPAPAATPPPPPSTPQPLAAVPPRERAFVDAGAALDPGLGDAWLRAGGWLRAAVRPSALPLFVHAGARYSGAPATSGDLSLSWLGASAGVGVIFELVAPTTRLELHADAVAQLLRARAEGASTSEAAGRWVLGGRVAGDAVFGLSPAWALLAGGEATALSSGTVVRVAGERRGRDASIGVGVLLGVRVFVR